MKKIILLGDSIRLSYQNRVSELLGSDFAVWGPDDNGRFASYTLRMLYDYREQMKDADVIHFNCGLWDMCDLFGDGPFTPIDVYAEQLTRIAKVLKTYAPGGAVIFATTTPPSPQMWGHDINRVRAYNAAAMAALEPLGVLFNDLFTPVAEDMDRMISEDLLHASPFGVEVLASRVADCIKKNT
ncbi:MAG: SGNH/GDSL hydrolase family protein [Clostridia bacterium]|nr:SGNH/GDSL hydrolase family protein [Clostridia bacterium]MBP3667340.1 SGNH/GDSL hydrolase family protein [Clostridia bacterium]